MNLGHIPENVYFSKEMWYGFFKDVEFLIKSFLINVVSLWDTYCETDIYPLTKIKKNVLIFLD